MYVCFHCEHQLGKGVCMNQPCLPGFAKYTESYIIGMMSLLLHKSKAKVKDVIWFLFPTDSYLRPISGYFCAVDSYMAVFI